MEILLELGTCSVVLEGKEEEKRSLAAAKAARVAFLMSEEVSTKILIPTIVYTMETTPRRKFHCRAHTGKVQCINKRIYQKCTAPHTEHRQCCSPDVWPLRLSARNQFLFQKTNCPEHLSSFSNNWHSWKGICISKNLPTCQCVSDWTCLVMLQAHNKLNLLSPEEFYAFCQFKVHYLTTIKRV